MTPDPQAVREIAREHIRSGIADIGTTVVKHFGSGKLGDEEYVDWYHAVVQAWRVELRAVSWPDEQQPADVVTGEQQDGAVGRNIDDLLSDENLDAHRIPASIAAAVRQLRWELKLAIAHDRQPYPTAEAYDRACAALNKCRERAEKAEAERREDVAAARRERDEAKAETANLSACLMLMMARYGNQTFHEGDVKRAAELMAAMAADAAQDGLSATETAEDGVQGSGDAGTPVRATEGLSETEGGCPWCGILQKLDADGLIGEHRRFNGTRCPGATRRPNDATEDGQHG